MFLDSVWLCTRNSGRRGCHVEIVQRRKLETIINTLNNIIIDYSIGTLISHLYQDGNVGGGL